MTDTDQAAKADDELLEGLRDLRSALQSFCPSDVVFLDRVMAAITRLHEDNTTLRKRVAELEGAARAFDECLSSDCDGPERDALRAALGGSQ
jgi:hypothetical protein